MKTTLFKYHLSISLLALLIGMGMPVLAQAQDAANAGAGENAEATNSGNTGTDADYDAESNGQAGKVEGYKHYYVDQKGRLNAMLSSELPPDAESTATEASDQPEQPQPHQAKKHSGISAAAQAKPPSAPTAQNDDQAEVKAGVEAAPVQYENKVANTAEDQPVRKHKHQPGKSDVASTDESSKPAKPSPVVEHLSNGSTAKMTAESDRKTRTQLAHLKLFRHRIKRTEAEKMADGQDAASGQVQQ